MYKSVDKEEIKIIMICVHAQCEQKTKQRYYRKEHAGHKSKSGRPVKPFSISGTLFLLFVQQTYQNIARISSISLVH